MIQGRDKELQGKEKEIQRLMGVVDTQKEKLAELVAKNT